MQLAHKVFESNFTIFPSDTNYMYPMVFGGKMLSEMDVCAAMAVRRALYGTECDSAVTVAVRSVNFLVGAIVGDLVFLHGEIIKLGNRSLDIRVVGWREQAGGERQKICEGEFVFASRRLGIIHPHGLTFGE